MGKLLQIVGVLALLGWTGAGVGAWLLTKEQVHVTIEDGAGTARGVEDPVALLGERIGTLERDLRALAGALGENFQALDENLAAAGDAHAAAAEARIAAGFAAWDARWATARTETRSLEECVAQLVAEIAELRTRAPGDVADPAAPPAGTAEPTPRATAAAAEPTPAGPTRNEPTVNETTVNQTTVAEPPVSDPAPPTVDPTAVAAADPAPPPRKRSFLAFRLPSDDFSFEGMRTWEVVPTLSRVGFDAKSTLHDFSGVTSKVTARLETDLAHPSASPRGTIRVDAASLDTGLADRNTAMCEHLATAEHAAIVFEFTAFDTDAVDPAAQTVRGTAKGRMTIHGVARDVAMPVRMNVDASRRLRIEGEAPLKMSDYGIEVPSKLGMISVTDEVRIWVSLLARPVAKENR